MARHIRSLATPTLTLTAGALALGLASPAEAATPSYWANQAQFEAEVPGNVTDDYTNPAYVFIQDNPTMSAVIGETDYQSTGFNNLNIVSGGPGFYYCAGCNGSFELSFQTTSVGTPVGVNGVGINIQNHNQAMPYFAYITFGDGTTADIQLPGAGNFWGVTAPERIERIHFGLSMGGTTQNGSFSISSLIVGDGNVGGCDMDADCFEDGDPCTDPVCVMGMCQFAPNVDPCDDGNPCTEMDVCANGVCDGAPVSCDDGNECTDEFCDPAAGCIIQLNSNPCDDGDLCTQMDQCSMGMCSGMPLDCNDDNVCSMDSCDPAMGCMNDPVMGCCLVDQDCGDEEFCDPATNTCMPSATGESSSGGMGDDTSGTSDPGTTTAPADDSSGDGGTMGGSGVGDSGGLDAGGGSSSGGAVGTTTGVTFGELPDPDFNTCECRADPSPQGRLWWLMVALGVFARRRRKS